MGLTALQYVCTSSLCTLTKKDSNPLQQTPASALAGSNTDAVELISIDCEHCSLVGAKRPRNFKGNIFHGQYTGEGKKSSYPATKTTFGAS